MRKAMQLKSRIKNLALKNKIPAQAVLQNFMMEHLLERISISKYKDIFILKGGMLIASMIGIGSRTTMDMDATIRGYPLLDRAIQDAFTEICAISLDDDDVVLTLNYTIPIREEDEYGGYRLAITARYEAINTPLKIDITTEDTKTPKQYVTVFIPVSKKKELKSGRITSKPSWQKKLKQFFGEVCSTPASGIFMMYIS